MRARLLLTAVTMGATLLVGGAATAQASSTSSEASTASTATAMGWIRYHTYPTVVECLNMADNYGGEARCIGRTLYIWVDDLVQ
ncbi:hypothetical protein [Streptosporangium sp. NPDC051022]|uniref:hypothetical protein n=1 Tax=Streptosporangium sp. NPDC051022 TaxID=3155752 RepID=UPI003412D453